MKHERLEWLKTELAALKGASDDAQERCNQPRGSSGEEANARTEFYEAEEALSEWRKANAVEFAKLLETAKRDVLTIKDGI